MKLEGVTFENVSQEIIMDGVDILAELREAQAEISRLQVLLERREKLLTSCMMQRDSMQADVERLSVIVDMNDCKAFHAGYNDGRNDALDEAADTILTSLADIHIEDGTIDAFNHVVSKCRAAIRALKDKP